MRLMLSGKVHRARVTEANLDYEGSITVDAELLTAADIVEYEQVHVLDVSNGARLTTYAIRGKPGGGEVCINGAAAHLVRPGDIVIILAYRNVSDADAADWQPHLVYVDEQNRIVRTSRDMVLVH